MLLVSFVAGSSLFKHFSLTVSTILACVLGMDIATAQSISSDGTLPNPTQVTENGGISEITGGTARGDNLFHSFQDFSVGTGNEALFDNADNIANILGRITGGNTSSVDGLIRANGSANLFLINPAGIVFGQNARLDLGGSFYGSTADSILFENGEFSAADLNNPPVLTINAPIGLGFRDNPADITVRGNGNGARLLESEAIDTQDALRVDSEATIGLGAGDIQLQGRNISLSGISAIETNTLGEESGGGISVFADEAIAISGVENELAFISAFGSRVFPTGSADGGDIDIETGRLTIGDRASIATATLGRGDAGDITIEARDSINLESQGNISAISANVTANAVGNGGNIELTTGSLTLNDNAFINAETLGQGNAGNVLVDASNFIAIEGNDSESLLNAGINVSSGGTSQGNGGNIELNTGSLTLNNGASLVTLGDMQSSGGIVTIRATDNIALANNSNIFVAAGEGGAIAIKAKNLSMTSGSSFFGGITPESGFSEARSGDITISLTEDLTIDGLGSEGLTYITNASFGEGNPGNIAIEARNITFQNGGQISANSNSNNVKIGDITLNATENILFDGIQNVGRSGISNFLTPNATGSIGTINLTAQNLTLTNGGTIGSQVTGVANSGNINLTVADSITIDGFDRVPENANSSVGALASNIFSNITTGTGKAGNININTSNLKLSRNGAIEASIIGQGTAGNINIDAEQITLGEQGNKNLSPSSIDTGTLGESQANGGSISIDTNSLFISDGSDIDSSATGVGNGGNIQIKARDLVSVDGTGILFSRAENRDVEVPSAIEADVLSDGNGNGGSIEIDTGRLIVDNNALVSADVFRNSTGNGGSIAIRARSVEVFRQGTIRASVLPDSRGTGGNLTIESDKLLLDRGSIAAATQSGQGANIFLLVDDTLQLENDSSISAIAFNEANGGNIDIDAGFVIASPAGNNDIIASAAAGLGGNINLTTEALLGIEQRPQSPFTNDIDASSEFGLDGNVAIGNPDVDVIRGSTELPVNPIEPEQTIAEACSRNTTIAQNRLIIGGSGMSPTPTEPLISEHLLALDNKDLAIQPETAIATADGNISPARGVVVDRQGKIELVAYSTSNRQQNPVHQSSCN